MDKKRADCYFGIHFDFHAMSGQAVCEYFRPDLIARVLDELKPDRAVVNGEVRATLDRLDVHTCIVIER